MKDVESLNEATIYAFKMLAAAEGRLFTTCVSFCKPIGHPEAAVYLSTWIVPKLERASGLSYKEWCKEQEEKQRQTDMEKMYRGCAHTGTITPFEVQNSTPKTVVFKNSVGVIERELKTTENHCWMETKEECREWLLTIYKNKVNAAQWAIEYNQSLIKNVNEQ